MPRGTPTPVAPGSASGSLPPPRRARVVRSGVHLTTAEVFDACQALANADRALVAAGTTAEADALGDLFELLEDRMTRS